MRRACVIGWPISHSRSPLIHGYWLKALGIDGAYDRLAIPPKDLGRFITTISPSGIVGCNVTIPHKEAVAALVHIADPVHRRIGSINTIYMDPAGRLAGESTDGEGFWEGLAESVPRSQLDEIATVLVLGAGGASRAVIAALIQHTSARIHVVARNLARAVEASGLFSDPRVAPGAWPDLPRLVSQADLIVNTTPLGMVGYPELDLDLAAARPTAIVYDLVYVPLETNLLSRARARGLVGVGGLGMLLHQAAPGFERWFGFRPKVTPELRDLVARDITGDV
jgi:shikimate dehydrogenase